MYFILLTALYRAGGLRPDLDYLCVGYDDYNLDYPQDCTKYVSCSNELAIEMDCPPCSQPDRCIDGKKVYKGPGSPPNNVCDWADLTPCREGSPATNLEVSDLVAGDI